MIFSNANTGGQCASCVCMLPAAIDSSVCESVGIYLCAHVFVESKRNRNRRRRRRRRNRRRRSGAGELAHCDVLGSGRARRIL